jgi:hypothetical protein
MDLILLVVALAAVGFVVWLITTHVPMPHGWAKAIQGVTLVVLILYLLSRFLVVADVLPR